MEKESDSKFDVLKNEISGIKKELNSLSEQKEHWYKEKDKVSQQIREKIRTVKDIKNKRDKLTGSVKENKEERIKLEKEIEAILPKLKTLKDKRNDIFKKHNLSGRPEEMQRRIRILEEKIEVEVMSFDKEKKMMKEIKDLKSKLSKFNVAEDINKELREVEKEFRVRKAELRKYSTTVKRNAADSQVEHNELIKISKEIDELKKVEEEKFKKFMDFKEKYQEQNKILKNKLKDFNLIRGNIQEQKQTKKKEKEEKIKKDLNNLKKEVDKKLKKGQKLTTDDLMVFQNT